MIFQTLLPEIHETVNLIRQQLDNTLSNDEDSQRFLFSQSKLQASNILTQLARVLYIFSGIRVSVPKSLEHQLICGYRELATEVNYIPREWQIPANRDEYMQKLLTRERESAKSETGESKEGGVSMSNISGPDGKPGTKPSQDDDTRSVRSEKSSRAGARSKAQSRMSNLADIAEHDPVTKASKDRVHTEIPTIIAPSRRESKSGSQTPGLQHRPKTRIEKFKTGMHLDPKSAAGKI